MKTRFGDLFHTLFLAAAAMLLLPLPPSQAETDFNLVGKNVSLLSQNMHFERKVHDDDLSKRFLKSYLQKVDRNKLYFTRVQIEEMEKKLGRHLDDYLLGNGTVEASDLLYDFYRKNALKRLEEGLRILEDAQFNFDREDAMPFSRQKVEWPENEKELASVWRQWIKSQLLEEVLRAEKSGDKDSENSGQAAQASLKARYNRMMEELKQPVDKEKRVNLLLAVVVNSLDPHSEYMGAETGKRFKDEMGASLIGIGIQFYADDDGNMAIGKVVPGGPAAKSGQIKVNDRIVAIDAQHSGKMVDVAHVGVDKASELIRGREGSKLRLKIKTGGGEDDYKTVSLTRSKLELKDSLAKGEIIDMPNGSGSFLRIGILTLPSFYADMDGGERSCSHDVKRILERMVAEKTQGLVFDLRGNPGGAMDEAIKMAGFFTGRGPQVQVKDSWGNISCLSSENDKPVFNGKVVVLMDKSSASASEILAASLQDYGRAIIVGDASSFGKGTVQEVIPVSRFLPYFADSSGAGLLKLTTQKYYRIEGGSTQFKGVESDIVIPSLISAFDIGEDKLDFALPYDSVAPVKGYSRDVSLAQILPGLKERSAERLARDPEYKLVLNGIERIRRKREENRISLNRAEREKEYRQELSLRKSVIEERKQRFPEIARHDEETLKIYSLSLDDLDRPGLNPVKDRTSCFDDRDGELLNYPSGLDPVLRESLCIMSDLMGPKPGHQELTGIMPVTKNDRPDAASKVD